MIYFDHNATAPLCRAAREAWLEATERYPANPSSPHRLGARAEAALNDARQAVAVWLKCSPLDIIWTSGATEANNAIFHHVSLDAPGEVWVSSIEHPSALEAVQRWCGGRVKLLPVTRDGTLNLGRLAEELKQKRPALIALMAANNETGVLQPWREALRLCREREVPFFCDAAQWIGKLPSAGLGECEFVTGCAHKFGGPVGTGFMKVPSHFRGLLLGGGQEDGRRAGTENLPAVLAMKAAWELRERLLAKGDAAAREAWRDQFIRELAHRVPEIEVVGRSVPRLWNTVTALMPPMPDCRRRWVVRLDKLGFAVSTGSACASGKEKPSHVITAMGYPAGSSDRMLRFSAGWESTERDWQNLLEGIMEAVEEGRRSR